MIELSGLTVFDADLNKGDIEIKFTGLRPGEKLYEELLIGNTTNDTNHPKIKYANEEFLPWPEFKKYLLKIVRAMKVGDENLVITTLKEIVSGFKPDRL